MSRFFVRALLAALTVPVALVTVPGTRAQEFPAAGEPVRIVVPFTAGGSSRPASGCQCCLRRRPLPKPARRHKEIVAALALPDVRAQFLNRALIPAPRESPAAYSTNAAIPAGQPRGASRQAYKTFLRPYALRIPKEAEGMVRVLHVHGTGLDLARIKDYPCDVINLSDRLAGNPSLRDLRP